MIVDKRLIKEMGRRGRDLTPGLRKTGYSGHKISKLTGVNPRTINILKMSKRERGNEENFPRTGRRRKTDSRADRRLFGWPEKNEGRLWKTLPLNLTTIQWKIFLPGL